MVKKNIFAEIVASRYSCRKYSDETVSAESISYLLEQIRLAPSACNRQPWRVIIITPDDEAGRAAVAAAYDREWARTAPYYVVMCGVPSDAWVRPSDRVCHMYVDVAIATEHLCLAADALGLGTCWICNFDSEKLTAGLGLNAEIVPIAIIPIGHPAEGTIAPEKKRKNLEEILLKR